MAETIADYLVRLGFKVEKGEEARFNALLGSLAKTAAAMAASLAAATGTIAATVIKVAESFDQLHFAAQRTNASVSSIKSLSYALSQVGGSSDQASAAIEGIAAAIRTNPGTEALLNNIGVATRENGRLRETGALIDDIVGALSKKPYYVSQQIASVLGMPDERAWNTFTTQWPKIRQFQKEYEERAKSFGLDPDKAAASSNKLMTSFRELMSTVDILSQKIVIELQPILTKWLEAISAWFKDHREDIVKALETVMKAAQGLATDFGHLAAAMKPVADGFLGLVKSVGGEEGGLKWALEALLVFMTGRWLIGMLGAIGRVGGVWGAIAGLGLAGIYSQYKNPIGQTAGATADGILPGMPSQGGPGMAPGDDGGAVTRRGWSGLGGWLKEKLGFGGMKDGKSSSPRTRGSSPAHGANTNGVDRRLLAAAEAANKDSPYDARISSGYRPGDHRLHGQGDALDFELYDRKTGKKLPNYQDPEAVAAYKAHAELVRKKYIEGGGDPNDLRWGGYFGGGKGEYGAFDLMHIDKGGARGMPMGGGDWEHGFTPEMIKTWGLDPKINDKVSALMNPAPLGGSTSRSATLSQKTDITIIGSSDPAGSAASLGGAQNRIGAELIRNAQSAFA